MAEETLGAPPGAHQDPNSTTRSIGEPGMPEISCIANEADDLRPLRMGPILNCYVCLSENARIPVRLESIAKKPGGISEHFAIVGRISW